MREKVMKQFESKLRIVYVDQYVWENVKSTTEKSEYLNKLGLSLNLTN